jgi:predicted DNA-binding transcriptional regulator YafY
VSEVVRLYQYKGLLTGRRALSAESLMAKLEISRATLKRDLAKLRDQLHVPIEFDMCNSSTIRRRTDWQSRDPRC